MLNWVEQEKSFTTSGPGQLQNDPLKLLPMRKQ